MTDYVSVTAATFVSERQIGKAWVDCVDTSLVMLADCAKPGVAPPTLAEAQRLRSLVPYPATGGTDPVHYLPIMKTRYGLSATAFNGTDDALIAAVPVGKGAAVCGRLANLSTHLRRFSPSFLGGHCTLILHLSTGWWWVDPLAPEGAGYEGEAITESEVRAFYTNGANGGVAILPLAVVPPPPPVIEAPMLAPIDNINPVLFDAPIGVQVYDEAVKPLFKTTVAIAGRWSPYGVTVAAVPYRVFAGQTGTGRVLMLIKSADAGNQRDPIKAAAQAQYDLDAKSIVVVDPTPAPATAKLSNARP